MAADPPPPQEHHDPSMPQVGYADAQRKRMTGILIIIGIVLLAFGVWLIILGSG